MRFIASSVFLWSFVLLSGLDVNAVTMSDGQSDAYSFSQGQLIIADQFKSEGIVCPAGVSSKPFVPKSKKEIERELSNQVGKTVVIDDASYEMRIAMEKEQLDRQRLERGFKPGPSKAEVESALSRKARVPVTLTESSYRRYLKDLGCVKRSVTQRK